MRRFFHLGSSGFTAIAIVLLVLGLLGWSRVAHADPAQDPNCQVCGPDCQYDVFFFACVDHFGDPEHAICTCIVSACQCVERIRDNVTFCACRLPV